MRHYGIVLTQPKSPRVPALYYAGMGNDGEITWAHDLLRCRPFHTQGFAKSVMGAVREWASRQYAVPVKVELVGLSVDHHGSASGRAVAEMESGRAASMMEAKRQREARRTPEPKVHHAKVPCRTCGRPIVLTGSRGRARATCGGRCREVYDAQMRRKQRIYSRKYFVANRDRILAQREESKAQHSEREATE